jgi:type VI secretion system protein ImpF
MRQAAELPVTLSILDRLIDSDPRSATEPPLSRAQSLRMFRSAVRRDLEWLLNSRRIAVEPDPSLAEVCRSVYVMGLSEFTGYGIADPKEQARLLQHLQMTIAQFEPRLTNLRITPQGDPVKTRQMGFRIEGSLLVDPAPERISFDTVLQLSSGEYLVKEAS